MLRIEEGVRPELQGDEAGRAHLYGFLAGLLAAPPSAATLAALAAVPNDGSTLGRLVGALSSVAARTSVDEVECEFSTLFIGLTAGELQPYASYYQTGFLFERPLANLRRDMQRLSIGRGDNVHEPEDHIAALCEMMQGLILGRYGPPADLSVQRAFFAAHMAPWVERFFHDLEKAEACPFYRQIGVLGRAFMAIEEEAFVLAG
ncbi:MAG: molecular chaperone TorD family protein [Rhodospirillales bacterium]|nr:molecular chaperone TorD family protein [Rhodospirillales bacterium]